MVVVPVWPAERTLAMRFAPKRLVVVAEVAVALPVMFKLPTIVDEA